MRYELKWKTASVVGIGVSNRPLIDFLLNHGVEVTARDRKSEAELGGLAAGLREMGVRLVLGDGYLEDIREEVIFRSPGIRYDIPQFQEAVARGSVLTSEMELFMELTPATVIGITGSDGKTTTTTLTAMFLREAGHRVYMGGNIGTPLLSYVEEMTAEDFAVVELSSFQLQTMKISPQIAAVTNLSPNHLDYHRGMEEYIQAKTNIFTHPRNRRVILNEANETTRELCHLVRPEAQTVFFNHPDGAEYRDGSIYLRGKPFLSAKDILIPGRHNIDNYMTAILLTENLVPHEVIRHTARTFGGVEHRMELVRIKDGVRYINSSIDSTPTRTCAALSCFTEPVIVICGGYDKHIPFDTLAEGLCRSAKAVVLTGNTAQAIADALRAYADAHPSTSLPAIQRESDFERAVLAACSMAKKGDTVLLSPACASFDAFPNFMVRGNRFKEIVCGL